MVPSRQPFDSPYHELTYPTAAFRRRLTALPSVRWRGGRTYTRETAP